MTSLLLVEAPQFVEEPREREENVGEDYNGKKSKVPFPRHHALPHLRSSNVTLDFQKNGGGVYFEIIIYFDMEPFV